MLTKNVRASVAGSLRLVAVLALLATGHTAMAGNILSRAGSPGPTPAGAAAAASQAAAAQAAAAAALARQAESPLRRAMDAIRSFQATQDAARGAALGAPSTVPNGLGTGGLDPLSPAAGGTWLNASQPTQASQGARSEVTIVQTSDRAILTWNTFNVGRETDLTFDQSAGGKDASGWVALNRVLDPTAAPSRILGSIKADGQVYVINRNGIIFGGTSQVNVGALVVAGLDIAAPGASDAERLLGADQRFLKEALSGLSFARPAAGSAGPVTVEAGAALAASDGGRVVLLGGSVLNAGSITAPDGQVFLAAGGRIQLSPSADLTAVRGLAPPDAAGLLPVVLESAGAAWNTGTISARRGNITMVGAETRQDGLLTVTNGAEAPGSIVLGAGGFTTSLGPGSVTQILPDLDDKKVLGSGAVFRPSSVQISGDRIDVLADATVYAPSGTISLVAAMTAPRPEGTTDPLLLDDTRIYVASGARLDVSGLTEVPVAMAQNSIQGELRASELRDNPLLRTGALRSRPVWFDARLGGKLEDGTGVANLSGYYDLVGWDVAQLMTAGGTVKLSANQIITRPGSVIDLSGGSLRYQDGYVRRTVLVDATGRRTPIEEAVPGVKYVGTADDFVVAHGRWGAAETFASSLTPTRPHFEQGYLQGSSAGRLILSTEQTAWSQAEQLAAAGQYQDLPVNPSATGAVRILDGTLAASTVVGPRQRELPTGSTDPARSWRERPSGATVSITGAGDVTIGGPGPVLGSGFGRDSAVDPGLLYQHALPAAWFDGATVRSVSIVSGYDSNENPGNPPFPGSVDRAPGGHLTVGPGSLVDLGDGGSFSFSGKSVALDGTLLAPGGAVAFTTLDKDSGAAAPPTIHLGPQALIDLAGRWSNDAVGGPTQPLRALQGGSASLSGGAVLLDAGSRIDVSGGGRLDASGAKLTAGAGGSITLDVTRFPRPTGLTPNAPAFPEPLDGRLVLAGTLDGHALGKGGSLTIRTPLAVVIGGGLDPGAGLFSPGFFTRGGFAAYTLVGERGVTVTGELAPSVESFTVPERPAELPSGTRLADVSPYQVAKDPGGLGQPMSLTLSTGGASYSALAPRVQVAPGAAIRMEPGSSVTLASSDAVDVDGTIEARGGAITLTATGLNGPDGIELGAGARLDVSGYQRTSLQSGTEVRSVERAGTIVLSGGAGGLPAPSVTIDAASVIDASGFAGTADLATGATDPGGSSRTTPVAVQGDAGSVAITATGGVVAGSIRLGPGADPSASGPPAGHGGSLSISSAALVVSQALPAPSAQGGLRVVADSVDVSGADDVALQVLDLAAASAFDPGNAILFDGSVSLTARRSLSLVSPILGTVSGGPPSAVTLQAGYVALVGGPSAAPSQVSATDLGSTLTVKADLIDVAKTVLLGCARGAGIGGCGSGGFGTALLDAGSGDIRLSNHDPAGRDDPGSGSSKEGAYPGLLSPGALAFQAGQVYVVSRGHKANTIGALERSDADPGFLVQSATRISLKPPELAGPVPPVPLSFGERLTLRAPDIEQGGVLRAPAGQIRLEGQALDGTPGTVNLLPGSTTSVSLVGPDGAAAVVPFGEVQAGGVFFGYHQPGQSPALSVKLGGAKVTVAAGATVDVSGGGDLLGYTFSPGNGGSSDVLGSITDANGNPLAVPALGAGLQAPFAIVPSLGARPAPIGPVASLRDPRLRVGDQVWLQGVPGLPDGAYTLLPAHDALLPGGLLVLPLGGAFASAPDGYVRPDGAVVAAGYRLVAGTSIRDAGYGRFAVMPASVYGAYSELGTASFDQFATRIAAEAGVPVRTPYDGGSLVLAATTDLVLQGKGLFGAGPGGLLGNLDVSAARIAVAGPAQASKYAGSLVVDPQALTDFGAGSVLLGGTRSVATSAGAPGTLVTTTASEVVVDTGGGAWTGPEILLAALGQVTVADGSVLHATGIVSRDSSTLRLSGSGALLRLSTGGRVGLVRTGGSAGALTIGASELSASGSMAFDAGGALALSPGVSLSSPQLDLASSQVHLGDAPAGVTGTVIPTALIEQLSASSDLLIRGQQAIWLHGALQLGASGAGAGPQRLALDTPLLQGDGTGSALITTGELLLRNSGAPSSGGDGPSLGTGTLELDLDSLLLGPGQVQLAGYGLLAGRAGTITLGGSGGLAFGGALGSASSPFLTSRIQSSAGARFDLALGGGAYLGVDQAAGPLPAVTSLGGRLSLSGSTVSLDTSVVLPAGTFEATATGGALALGPDALIDVSGRDVDFADLVRFAPGGSIRLTAAGDLTTAAGAALDVSGSPRGGDAGRIELSASQGQVAISGVQRGQAGAGFRGGAFSLDAGSLTGFTALNQGLELGGFTESRAVRLRGSGQDLTLGQGDRITAHDVTLRADAGRVDVAGAIGLQGDASHPAGGVIELSGAVGVRLEASATVDARAAASDPEGFVPASGKVLIAATGAGGRVDVEGASVDVSGGRDGGAIVVRAPRTADGAAVGTLEGKFTGAAEQVLQGVQTYRTPLVDAPWLAANPLVADGATWLAAARAAHPQGIGGFELAPAMVVTSDAGLSIQGSLSLAGLDGAGHAVTGGPGQLSFVAVGDIAVGGVISDGFAGPGRGASLLSGRSFGLSFETDGSVTLAAGALIRTGTGDLSVRAGGDLRLLDPTAAIYTAGEKAGWASGFQDQGVPTGMPLGEFPVHGGSIELLAGGSIVAPMVRQTTSAWLYRYGDTTWRGDLASSAVAQQASWSVVYANFEQGVGALGGGDVRVRAGRDVRQLQVAIPTTGQVTASVGQAVQAQDLVVRGGGDLHLSAGRDLLGGLFVLGRGHADLGAGGDVAASGQGGLRTSATSTDLAQRPVGLLLGLADATAVVSAAGSATVEGAFDPMRQGQVAANLTADGTGSAFFGYSDRTALTVNALSANATYLNDPWASVDLSLASGAPAAYRVQLSGSGPTALNELFGRAPPTLRLTSLLASVSIEDRFGSASTLRLASAPRGTLELLAGQDVRLALDVTEEEVAPRYVRGWGAPFATTLGAGGSTLASVSNLVGDDASNSGRGFTPVHLGDPEPARLYAIGGSVCAQRSGSCTRLPAPLRVSELATLTLPKPLHVLAGLDVLAGEYKLQGNGPGDLSLISAGRDVYQPVLELYGQGTTLVQAGRDVVLGEPTVPGSGARKVPPPLEGGSLLGLGDRWLDGSGANRALPRDHGMSLYVLAGVAKGRVDVEAFTAAYLDPADAAQRAVHDYLPALRAFMSSLDASLAALDDGALVAAFRALPQARREVFLAGVLFTELKETGIDYNDPESPRHLSYQRGFQAVKTLFPLDPASLAANDRGNVLLHGKRVETEADAGITVLAPYGRVEVGTDVLQAAVDPSLGGVVTRRGGDVRIMADQNIDLFNSRVFTLQGGDITMWTTDGSITAGAGSKTSVFQRPLSYAMTKDGVVEIDAFGLQTGAGIGVLDALANAGDRPASRLDLIAPRGEVNAGDAGIRVVGNLNIAAAIVVGAENIQASGVKVGVPTVEAPNVGALTSASSVAQAATKEGVGPQAAASSTAADLPSIITVEVVGYEALDPEDPARKKKGKSAR